MKYNSLWLVMSLMSGIVLAADAPTRVTTTANPAGSPRVVRLTLSPAPAPRPALRYTLLPEYLDQQPGNAVQQMYMAAQAVGRQSQGDVQDKGYGRLGDWLAMTPEQRPAVQVDETLARARDALHYARLAALRDHAFWDIPRRTDCLAMLMPDLRPYRTLSMLLTLRAGRALAMDRFDDALTDLQTSLTLARWTAGPTPVHNLVAAGNAQMTTEVIEAWIGRPKSPNLYWAIVNLPKPLFESREAYEFERFSLVSQSPLLARLSDGTLSEEEADRLLGELVALRRFYEQNGLAPPAGVWESVAAAKEHLESHATGARDALCERGYARQHVDSMSPAQAGLLLRFTLFQEQRDELLKLLPLPYWQSAERIRDWERQIEEMKGDQPDEAFLFLDLLPKMLPKVHFSVHRLERSLAALQVLEAIRMHMDQTDGGLPASLQDIRIVPLPIDPITGKDFVYERTATGARLILPTPDPSAPQNDTRYELSAVESGKASVDTLTEP